MATHSSILAWKISWMEKPDRLYCQWGGKESDTTEQLHFHFHFSSPKLRQTCTVLKLLFNQLLFKKLSQESSMLGKMIIQMLIHGLILKYFFSSLSVKS